MRQSFRPFAWCWGPNEERPMWTTLFNCVNLLCVAVGGYTGDVKEIFGVAIIDHKESTKTAIKDTYSDVVVCQCFTHVMRNARSKKSSFQGTKEEKKRQVRWFVRQVRVCSLCICPSINFHYLALQVQLLHRTPECLMAQRWALIKHEMDQQCPTVRQLALSFERTNMNPQWTGWAHDSSKTATIPTDSQIIESWHNAMKACEVIDTNRVKAAKVSGVD